MSERVPKNKLQYVISAPGYFCKLRKQTLRLDEAALPLTNSRTSKYWDTFKDLNDLHEFSKTLHIF